MAAKIIDGKILAQKIKSELKLQVEELKKSGTNPSLAVIIVGDNSASRIYVNGKKKDCEEIGIVSHEFTLEQNTPEDSLIELIDTLNNNSKINGILVQLPLPSHINEDRVISSINPSKDVDCFHPYNVGLLSLGKPSFLPCTPAGIMEMIHSAGISVSGKECVVVGRSNIVGKPMAMMLLAEHGTVTVCHSKTKDLASICKRADILVAAIGKSEFIKRDFIKTGSIVIDVGMNRNENKLVGDVDFNEVSQIAEYITPVPGGVGPMTRAILMKNTVYAAIMQNVKL